MCIGGTCSNATSCLTIFQQNPATPDGIYTIDSDGGGGNPPYDVFCDMSNDGGGWTLVANVDDVSEKAALEHGMARCDGALDELWQQGNELPMMRFTTLGCLAVCACGGELVREGAEKQCHHDGEGRGHHKGKRGHNDEEDSDVTVTIEFDGSDTASWTSSDGQSGELPLSCETTSPDDPQDDDVLET